MKRVTLLSTLAGALLYSTTAMAQVAGLTGKVVKSIGTTAVTTLQTGVWYVMENQGNYAYDDGTGLWSGAKANLLTTGVFASNRAKVLFRVSDIQAPVSVTETGTDDQSYTGNVYGCKIQWGTGKYVKWPTLFNQQVLTTDNVADAEVVYFAPVADNTGTVRFAQKTTTEYGDGNNTMFDKNGNGKVSNWAGNGQSKLVAKGNSANGVWKVYEVELVDAVNVTVNAYEVGATEASFSAVMPLPIGDNYDIATVLPSADFLQYQAQNVSVTAAEDQSIDVTFTEVVPFATSYAGLADKWVSFFTLNGRMHVRDVNADGTNVAKYPTIDKATFTRLNDNYFWGFVCENPFLSADVKIFNKAAGANQTLYLTSDGNDVPVLMSTEADKLAGWVTNNWVLEKSTKADAVNTGDKYFGIRAQGTTRYINNNGNKGFMTTYSDGANKDNGSNHKFTKEIDTYNTLKERALKAPANAVHSLNATAREAIKNNTNNTVEGYKALNANFSENDYVEFDQSKYYMLRNYTPEGGNVYVLGSDDGAASRTYTVSPAEAGDADNVMACSNINAIWTIKGDGNAADGEGLGASRTIARRLTHVNSAKMYTAVARKNFGTDQNPNWVEARILVDDEAYAADYYFVDLGAGQHFLKNAQYNGSGQQAMAHPLNCSSAGVVGEGGNAHYKNSRDTWYGIQVKTIKVTLGATGYATLHLPFGVNLPAESDLKAFVVSATSGTEATMEEVTCIPANKGVILKGATNATYELTINDGAAWDASVINLLKGSNMHANIVPEPGKTCYVLSMPDGATKAGLYKAQLNQDSNTAFLNNDNKAYLSIDTPATGEAPSLSFVFDTVTSIKGIDSAKAANTIYDLSGRRVKAATKGIFIMGGKKVIK